MSYIDEILTIFERIDSMVHPIAEDLKPIDGYELLWGRHKVLKNDEYEDIENIELIIKNRYFPVAPCMYPEMPTANGRIESDGLVLYMRPIEDVKKLHDDIHVLQIIHKKLFKKLNKYEKTFNYMRRLGMIP